MSISLCRLLSAISLIALSTLPATAAPLVRGGGSGADPGVRVGIALPEIAQARASGVVFVDAMKQAAPWTAAGRLELDRLGNVTSLAAGQTAESLVYASGARYPTGDYVLLHAGKGTFAVTGATIVDRSPGRAVVRVTQTQTGLRLRLLATGADDYAHDVRLIVPGFERTYATQPFHPEFVRSLTGAGVLRFDAWMHGTTFAQSAVWPLRPTTGRFTQATPEGVAPEYAIALANATGASPWFALPVGATDMYIYSFADLVHRTLDPRLHPIFEYGDDVLTPGTPANGWARMAGTNSHLSNDPQSAAAEWYSLRTAQMLALVRRAFGPDAGRVVPAVAGSIARRAVPVSVRPNPKFAFAPSPAQPAGERARRVHAIGAAGKPNINQSPDSGRPLLSGSVGAPLEQVDLTREGSVDWIHWGRAQAPDRKAAAQERIGDLTIAGPPSQRYADDFTTYVWRDGNGLRSARTSSGVSVAGVGRGFTFSAPADGTKRTLRVYVGTDRGIGSLRATLSDGSARPYVDSSLDGASPMPANGVYTIVYRASGPGQRLDVTYTLKSARDAGARLLMQAATLQNDGVHPPQSPSDMLTFHYDNMRTGWDQNETTLTTANVSSGGFGLLSTLNVDGVVLAQPLYVAQYNVPSQGVHNLLIVVTEHDTVYEYDADTFALINSRSMGTSQSSNDVGCGDISPEYGITDTPVIDRSTGTIYLVAATEPSSYNFHHTLHALDIGTLSDQKTPVDISASVKMSNGSTISFDPQNQQTRTSLLEANGSIYVGVGSHCDNNAGDVVGWMLKYDKNLNQVAKFATAEDTTSYLLTSIWMSGYASAVDAAGNIFSVTGNGAFDANQAGHNYGESVIKLGPNLKTVLGFFTPSNWQQLNDGDTDFGSGGVMLLPKQQATVKNVAVAMGKDSNLYLLNRAKLGRLGHPMQTVQAGGGGVWGGPAYYSGPTGQFVYYQTGGDVVKAYQVLKNGGRPYLSKTTSGNSGAGYGGSSPVVSSNGHNPGTGILWLVRRDYTMTLEAYDATNLGTMLFSASAGSWSNPADNGFVTPLVANGRVYVPATGTVTVFGLP